MKHLPVWRELFPPVPVDPAATLPAEAPVVVIGGGITGAATLYHLARAGIPALLIEREHLAAGATGRNAGFLLAGTVEYFDEAVQHWGLAEAAAIWAFTFENNAAVKNAIVREAIPCHLEEAGQLVLAATDEEWSRLQRTVELLAAIGIDSPLLDANGVTERTGIAGFYGGRLQRDDAILVPAELVRGLGRAAVRLGARVIEGDGVGRLERAGTAWEITTAQGVCRTPHVVLASNAWLREIWPAFRGIITPVRAQALATAPVEPGLITGALSCNTGYEYWRQLPDGRVLLGGMRWTEPGQARDTLDLTVQPATHTALAEFLHRCYPALREVPITHAWTGLMAYTPDRLPLIGAVPDSEGAWVAGGYNGHGMAFGFLAGRILSDLISTGTTELEAERYSPARRMPV